MQFVDFSDRVTAHLMHGERNAIKASDLLKLTGFKNARAMRKFIELRRRDTVILSSENGYFLPDTDPEKGEKEVQHFIAMQYSRIKTAHRTTEAAKQYLQDCENAKSPVLQDSFME